MELWDVMDAGRRQTGRTMVRGEPIPQGDYHQVVHACVFNAQGKMLIQKRQPFKEGYSGMWDITMGGSAQAGETSQQAVIRELREEVGIDAAQLADVIPHLSVNFERGFDDFFLLQMDLDETKLQLQYEEVERVRWADRDEILAMIEDGTFIPYYDDLICLLFAMRGGRFSSHKRDAE